MNICECDFAVVITYLIVIMLSIFTNRQVDFFNTVIVTTDSSLFL